MNERKETIKWIITGYLNQVEPVRVVREREKSYIYIDDTFSGKECLRCASKVFTMRSHNELYDTWELAHEVAMELQEDLVLLAAKALEQRKDRLRQMELEEKPT